MDKMNLYGLSDETISQIEQEIETVVDSDVQTSEEFIDACFPNATAEEKAKIAMFAGVYFDLFMSEEQ